MVEQQPKWKRILMPVIAFMGLSWGIVLTYRTFLGEGTLEGVLDTSQAFLNVAWFGVTLYGLIIVFRYKLKTTHEVLVVAVSREHSVFFGCALLLGILSGLALFWYSPRVTIELSWLVCCFVGAAKLTQKYW